MIPLASWLLLVFILFPRNEGAASNEIAAPRTVETARNQFVTERQKEITRVLRLPVDRTTEPAWIETFWAMGLLRFTPKEAEKEFARVWHSFPDRSHSFQRSALECAHTLFPKTTSFSEPIQRIATRTSHPKIFAMAALYLGQSNPNLQEEWRSRIPTRFPNWENDPILTSLHHHLTAVRPAIPEVKDLLHHDWGDRAVIFSLQRRDRRYPGRLLIRRPDGRFHRTADGALFSMPLLALAQSNLPGFLTNGNTPSGIFAVLGTGHSRNAFIGPTESLILALPHEHPPHTFFHHAGRNSQWKKEDYHQLLPPSWQNHFPIWEAWRAGQAGRFEIIAHGTTINPKFYEKELCYPLTPSLGCLTTLEFWSAETGQRTRSDQQRLVDAWKAINPDRGFAVVADIDSEKAPVSLAEIEALLKKPGEPHSPGD
ncbi:MAG: hypothetical protein AAF514_16290 [Verrucomicrobiota bacterium]